MRKLLKRITAVTMTTAMVAMTMIPSAKTVEAKELSNGNNIVVAIDAGHDKLHPGATANGLHEEDLTLKIAKYCRDELEQYYGVKVVMIREDDSCPNPEDTSIVDNQKRTKYAQSFGASLFVSMHINSATSTEASGVEIIYPNENYQPGFSTQGQKLATSIMTELSKLGLSKRNFYSRSNTEMEDDGINFYPDGSHSDYYGIIRTAKLNGFPAVIVEHGYITNANDLTYFSSDDKLKELGVADAAGIANYLGLTKDANSKGTTVKPNETAANSTTAAVSNSENGQTTAAAQEVFNPLTVTSNTGNSDSWELTLFNSAYITWQNNLKTFWGKVN